MVEVYLGTEGGPSIGIVSRRDVKEGQYGIAGPD